MFRWGRWAASAFADGAGDFDSEWVNDETRMTNDDDVACTQISAVDHLMSRQLLKTHEILLR